MASQMLDYMKIQSKEVEKFIQSRKRGSKDFKQETGATPGFIRVVSKGSLLPPPTAVPTMINVTDKTS